MFEFAFIGNIASTSAAVSASGPAQGTVIGLDGEGNEEGHTIFIANDATDYVRAAFTTLAAAGSSLTISVPVANNTGLEPDEYYNVYVECYDAADNLVKTETIRDVIAGNTVNTIDVLPQSTVTMVEGSATPLFTTLATFEASDGQAFFEIIEGNVDNLFRISQNQLKTQG